MKIGFLYNHDALHQVSHTAPVIVALASESRAEVTVLTSSAAQAARVRDLIGPAATARVRFVALDIGPVARVLDAGLRWIAPFRRVAVLRENVAEFAKLDALVVPETTSLLLRDRFGLTDLKYVWIPHGAGDRSVGFRSVMRGFDLVLLSGAKVRDRMLAMELITPDNHAIVGYPKFDTVDLTLRPGLFDDDRPVILYNPHFDPLLSSWYCWGEAVVDTIVARRDVDLAVAPHVMLFQRRIHASLEHRRVHWRRDIPARWAGRDGLIVDPGSARSVDMTYTLGADIYIGDGSSQIYEWIARPRPAIFLNPEGIVWRNDPNFAHWHLGEVIDDMADLNAAIDRALADPHRFDAAQQDAFARTFAPSDRPAAARAAAAILALP
ncbi:hypothetical protein [Sphingomonas sp. Leaf33]|uniref:hypothetical protein n=1 Tax=Sphingomonas sp. Leaf33 TaxID=1736215 RepID=UPI000B226AF7|nr:hypothetical protein [Sphingomonas sp. Leaf33]